MKKEKTKEVTELVESFCQRYFTGELTTCALRLCDKLGCIRNKALEGNPAARRLEAV